MATVGIYKVTKILNTPNVEFPSDTLIIATKLLIHFLDIVNRQKHTNR
jgi:hypothetical protein